MTVEKIDVVWASDGVTSPEPSNEKKAVGWISGMNADRPYVEYFNYLQNRVENKINDLIDNGCGGFLNTDTSDINYDISTGLISQPWATTTDTLNVLPVEITENFVDLAVVFNSDNTPLLLCAEQTSLTIQVWNARTLELEDTSPELSGDLPAGTWEIVSMCTDGINVYVMFTNTGASPDTHYLQSWIISSWAVKTGWPATGRQLTGTGTAIDDRYKNGRVIVANSTSLATLNGWNVISADSSAAVSIISMEDGTITASGAGDAPTGVSAQATDTICSDGTNLYFVTAHSGPDQDLCTALISDPTAGTGGTGYPYNTGGSYARVCCIGNYFVASIDDLTIHTDTTLYLGDSSEFYGAVQSLGHVISNLKVLDFAFDGINIFAYIQTNSGNYFNKIIKIDSGKLDPLFTSFVNDIENMSNGFLALPFMVDCTNTQAYCRYNRCVYDGRDIWAIAVIDGGDKFGQIYRLPLASIRN